MALEQVQEDTEQANIDNPTKSKDRKYYKIKEVLNLQISYSYSLSLVMGDTSYLLNSNANIYRITYLSVLIPLKNIKLL